MLRLPMLATGVNGNTYCSGKKTLYCENGSKNNRPGFDELSATGSSLICLDGVFGGGFCALMTEVE